MDFVHLAIWLAAIVFGFMSVAHLVRIFKPFPVIIGNVVVPHWASYVFVIVGGLLSYFLFIAAGR